MLTGMNTHDKLDLAENYIRNHLSEPLSLDLLSDVAGISKFHFHRLFLLSRGVSVAQYIQRMRFKKASYQLAFEPKTKVIAIAIDAGFENPESFSRAFKRLFSVSPSEFRMSPNWEDWHAVLNSRQVPNISQEENIEALDDQIKIINFKETRLAVLEHRGAPETQNTTIAAFTRWRKQYVTSSSVTSRTFGLAFNDPYSVAAEDYRFGIARELFTPLKTNDFGVVEKCIPQSQCAVLRHLGPHEDMRSKIFFMYERWLDRANRSLADFPLFFHFINSFPQVDEVDLITDIYLPVV